MLARMRSIIRSLLAVAGGAARLMFAHRQRSPVLMKASDMITLKSGGLTSESRSE